MARDERREVGRKKRMEYLTGHGRSVAFLLEAGAGIKVFNQGKGMIYYKS